MKHTLFYRFAAALALGALLFSVAPRGASAQDRSAPYELNAILSVTGPGAFLGAPAGQTLKIIEGYVNATGGINGRPILVNVLDDQSNPQVALQLVNGLIAKNVALFMGPMLTASCAAVLPFIGAHGPVAYCVSPFVSPPPGSFMFMQGGSASDDAAVALRFLKERGLRRVAMLNATDASGQAADKALEAAFALDEFKEMTLVSHQYFSPADISVAAQAALIKTANPQAVISWNVGSAFGTAIHGLHDAGLDVPTIGNGANASEGQIRALAGFMPAELHFVVSPSWVSDARVPKAVLDAQATFRKVLTAAGVPTTGGYASDWDITLIAIEALRRSPPNPSAEQVRAAISGLRGWAGPNGVYDFRAVPQSGAGQTIYLLAHWDAAKRTFVSSSTPGGHVIK